MIQPGFLLFSIRSSDHLTDHQFCHSHSSLQLNVFCSVYYEVDLANSPHVSCSRAPRPKCTLGAGRFRWIRRIKGQPIRIYGENCSAASRYDGLFSCKSITTNVRWGGQALLIVLVGSSRASIAAWSRLGSFIGRRSNRCVPIPVRRIGFPSSAPDPL